MEFQLSYFKSWKIMLWKWCTVTGLEKVSFHSNPKERQCQKCSNYYTTALISDTTKVMVKILQARLQQYVNHELPDVQAGFRKGRGIRDQMANICWIIKKAREFQKTSISALLTMPKPLTVWITINWKILKEMQIPDHLSCLLRNLYAVRKQQLELDMKQKLVPNRKRSTSRKYIVTLLVLLICKVHHEKCCAGRSTSWNQDCWENYQ